MIVGNVCQRPHCRHQWSSAYTDASRLAAWSLLMCLVGEGRLSLVGKRRGSCYIAPPNEPPFRNDYE